MGFWDPASSTAEGDVENFQRRRRTELTYGRVSMLATMDYITPEITDKPHGCWRPSISIKFAHAPHDLAAISMVPRAGWAQVLAYSAFCKLTQDQSPGIAAASGGLGFKVLTSCNPVAQTKKMNEVLTNGRSSMMGIISKAFRDGSSSSSWGDWALYSDSPLRAFEKELGVQNPMGFWGLAGFTAEGDVENFQRQPAGTTTQRRTSPSLDGRTFI